MSMQKGFQTFTLRRLPFWVFFTAGVSGITLLPLFENEMSTGIVLVMSSAVILASLAARFRDVGLSAWLAPLGIIPVVALFVGFTPGLAGANCRSASALSGSGRRESPPR